MKAKALILASLVMASAAMASPAQAHDDYDYPYGLLGGLFLGLTWNHYYDHDYSHHHGDRYYRHRDYPRSRSYGRVYRDTHKGSHHRDRDRRGRGRWD
jgi:hypothetical protein